MAKNKALIGTVLKSLQSYCQSYPTAGHFEKNRHVYQTLKNSNDKSKGILILLELTSNNQTRQCYIETLLSSLLLSQPNAKLPLHKILYDLHRANGLTDAGLITVSQFRAKRPISRRKRAKAKLETLKTELDQLAGKVKHDANPKMSDSISQKKLARVYTLK
ncbi:hypothetical protein ACRN9T_12990 [Shewanella baltica]|uniref:hypothetical protein n=1 Tax=Shewanella baltica TaxID=62322 RepID=UPI003D78D837